MITNNNIKAILGRLRKCALRRYVEEAVRILPEVIPNATQLMNEFKHFNGIESH